MKALFIDVAARIISEVEYAGLADLQRMVGGSISGARSWDSGEVLFVDDEGLFKPKGGFFRIEGIEQPLAGNRVLVGRDRYDREGEYLDSADPIVTVADLSAIVRFLSRAEADAWAKANASEPASVAIFVDQDGTTGRRVLGRFGALFAQMPPEPTTPIPLTEREMKALAQLLMVTSGDLPADVAVSILEKLRHATMAED